MEEIKRSAQSDYLEKHSPCYYCKHLQSVGDNAGFSGWSCKAFPDGIPPVILKRRVLHKTILDVYPGQEMPFLFEGREKDGKQYDYKGRLI